MKRLTTRSQADLIKCLGCIEKSNCYGDISCNEVDTGIEKLKAYEDIGLEPEEILTIKKSIEMICKDFPRNVGEAINMLPVSLFEPANKN